MRFGIVADYEKIAMAKEAGFDYFEYNVIQLSKLSDDEYKALYNRVHELGFYAEAMCLMLPPRYQSDRDGY